MNKTKRREVNLGDQDMVEECITVEINNDEVVERTEYFTVSLFASGILLGQPPLASCQVAIIDKNGGEYSVCCIVYMALCCYLSTAGPSECYGTVVSGADLRVGRLVEDRE